MEPKIAPQFPTAIVFRSTWAFIIIYITRNVNGFRNKNQGKKNKKNGENRRSK
jgi:hypothetical protein